MPHGLGHAFPSLALKIAMAAISIATVLVVGIREAKAGDTTYTYDVLNRLVLVRYDASNMIYYAYDQAGNRTKMVMIGPDNPDMDSDGDSLPDRWELDSFHTLDQTGADDPDKDGANNRDERLAGTNPTNALSALRATGVRSATNDWIAIRWSSVDGKLYDLDRATNLVNPAPWQPLTNGLPATPAENAYTDRVQGLGPYFYRIRVKE